MTTASAWKNLRFPFKLRVGTRLSAASATLLRASLAPPPLDVDPEMSDLALPIGVGEAPCATATAASPGETVTLPEGWCSLNRFARASCLVHPATEIATSTPHQASRAVLVHHLRPSPSHRSTHIHGSRQLNIHLAQIPITPNTINPASP